MAIVGIDLGTTNSLVGLIEKGRPRLFVGEDQSSLIPSVVSFDAQGAPTVGSVAKQNRVASARHTIYSAKRFMGRGKKDVETWLKLLPFDFSPSDDHMIRFRIGPKNYTPIEISSFILKKLKTLAETQSGKKVDKAVITVPAYFDDSQRQATKFAGELAGLEVVRIINEPTAACLAYGLDKKAKGLVAVFDLGGGTFDLSILRIQEGLIEVLATNGDTALGGDDIDHAIAEALWGNAPASPEERAEWFVKSEKVKRELSEKESTSFDGKTVTRQDLAKWMAPILKRAEGPTRQALEDAKLSFDQITDVILVGGSTRSPIVRDFVKTLFRREPICTLNPDEVVAMGATVQANVLAGQSGEMLLLDVIPLSLGIETMGGVVSRIIHRNSTIPISASEGFTTYVDGQTAVDFHVVQGERELVKDNRSLARFQLRGLPPMPAGAPKIEVEFIVDANGILNVKAHEQRTGLSTSVQVNPSYGLSDTEVERMLGEAFDNAEADFSARFLAEARTEADSLMRATQKALEKSGFLLSAEEKTRIEEAVKAVQGSLSATDHHVIKQKLEVLNQETQAFAERILNQAVQEALQGRNLNEISSEKKP